MDVAYVGLLRATVAAMSMHVPGSGGRSVKDVWFEPDSWVNQCSGTLGGDPTGMLGTISRK